MPICSSTDRLCATSAVRAGLQREQPATRRRPSGRRWRTCRGPSGRARPAGSVISPLARSEQLVVHLLDALGLLLGDLGLAERVERGRDALRPRPAAAPARPACPASVARRWAASAAAWASWARTCSADSGPSSSCLGAGGVVAVAVGVLVAVDRGGLGRRRRGRRGCSASSWSARPSTSAWRVGGRGRRRAPSGCRSGCSSASSGRRSRGRRARPRARAASTAATGTATAARSPRGPCTSRFTTHVSRGSGTDAPARASTVTPGPAVRRGVW